jgi:crotonobetaine/carnitine-CoA ligase
VAVPSELGEDDVKAFVVARDGSSLDLAELRGSLDGKLSPFKIPRYLEQITELPLTPTGRVAKHQLTRDRTAAEVDFEGAPKLRERDAR